MICNILDHGWVLKFMTHQHGHVINTEFLPQPLSLLKKREQHFEQSAHLQKIPKCLGLLNVSDGCASCRHMENTDTTTSQYTQLKTIYNP